MIDIHSHILWGMDDGADSRETSLAMLKIATETGTTDIVATPHANFDYAFKPDLIEERIRDLQGGKKGISKGLPKIHRGCDFHLSFDNIQDALEKPGRYCINGKNFLLVEFANLQIPPMTEDIFAQLLNRNICPVITHPERNPILSKKLDQLAKWVDFGAFIQVTAQSFEGSFGESARDAAWEMLSHGIVHFVASDGHDVEHRPPRLDRAFKLVAARIGEEAERLFETNPRVVISGGDPEVVRAAGAGRKRRWFFGFGRQKRGGSG